MILTSFFNATKEPVRLFHVLDRHIHRSYQRGCRVGHIHKVKHRVWSNGLRSGRAATATTLLVSDTKRQIETRQINLTERDGRIDRSTSAIASRCEPVAMYFASLMRKPYASPAGRRCNNPRRQVQPSPGPCPVHFSKILPAVTVLSFDHCASRSRVRLHPWTVSICRH
jgi:hypothetical protein